MLQKVCFTLFLVFAAGILLAQNYGFKASLSENEVELGESFDLRYDMKGVDNNSIKVPKFEYFDIIAGPSSSYSMQSINGVTTEKQSVSYSLLPKKPGRYVIPAATATVKGKRIKSNLVKIEVNEADQKSGTKDNPVAAGREVFIKAEMSHDTAFLGQQIFVDYNIYFSVQVENWNMMNESDFNGFFARPLRMGRGRSTPVEIEGKEYYKQTLKRVALFPQQTGKLTIEASRFRIGISSGDPNERRSIWSRPQIKYKFVNSEELSVNVLELPEGAPASFSGAVGSFRVSSKISPLKLTTDDAFTINMNIVGDGDVKFVRAPDLKFDPNLEVYDKKVLQDDVQQSNNKYRSTLGMEFQVLPKKSGRYTITPEFTYFNPDSLRYITDYTSTYTVMVSKGTQSKKVDPLVAESESLSSNIRGSATKANLKTAGFQFRGSAAFWILSLLPLLGFLGAVAYKRMLLSRGEIDEVLLRQNEASKLAMKKLEKANEFMSKGDSRSFYDEISKALLGYTNDKLQISNAEMSKQKVSDELASREVSQVLIEKLTQVFKKSEMALFAGQADAQSMQATYDAASSVIVDIENDLT